MSEQFQYIATNVNINTDNALAAILARFNEDYIIDVIERSIDSKFRLYDQSAPNIVYAYEEQFKSLTNGFSSASSMESISVVRANTYRTIITILCNRYGLNFVNSEDIDLYSAAFYLYDFLVSNFTQYIITFYSNYLAVNRDAICSAFGLTMSSGVTQYSKKIFKNNQLSMIHGNIGTILYGMKSFEISLSEILDMVYSDKNIAMFILSLVSEQVNFFLNNYEEYVLNPDIGPEFQTQIRLRLQNIYGDFTGIENYITTK